MKTVLIYCFAFVLLLCASCKKCYECSIQHYCATCIDNSTKDVSTFCSRNYSSVDQYKSDLLFERNFSNCTERADANDVKEICNKGFVGKSILEGDKQSLEFDGYTCTLK